MILVIDDGSTKAEWAYLDDKKEVKRLIFNGFNPNFCDDKTITGLIGESLSKDIDNQCVEKIFFYGAGCGNEKNKERIEHILKNFFTKAMIEISPDTLAACHALFRKSKGIACILGTGSNACLFDGEKIMQSAVSLGFMIGDEGSGCHIGKKLTHDYFYKIMPSDLRQKFDEKYHLNRENFLKNVYQMPHPSRYLADFTHFAAENIENEYVFETINSIFDEFIKYMLLPLNPIENMVGFVGSVAFHFQDILRQHLENEGIICYKIIKNPMDGLVDFYKSSEFYSQF